MQTEGQGDTESAGYICRRNLAHKTFIGEERDSKFDSGFYRKPVQRRV